MALIVQKYGGTSVGTVERIQAVAEKVAGFHKQGDQVVVVVSAMSGETNRLIELANGVTDKPSPREMDVLVSTGEQVTIALLSMALQKQGLNARSYTGSQIPLRTDNAYSKARIEEIDDKKVRADLDGGSVVVVAGFQGVDGDGNITTLGRGGSDTTAVALAAALKADELASIPPTPVWWITPVAWTALPLRKCWRWRVRAPRSCRSVLWNSPANTMCRCVSCPVSRMALGLLFPSKTRLIWKSR